VQPKKQEITKKNVSVPILFLLIDDCLCKTLIYSILLYIKITLTRLFEGTNANNANTFQSKKIMVGDKTIDIPLIALISHHYLAMDNVQIKFKAKVGSVESQIPENNLLLSSPQRANLQMQMSNIKPDADDVMEVCVNFKVQETPESISRIIDDFVKNI